jgi:hypothetical protein
MLDDRDRVIDPPPALQSLLLGEDDPLLVVVKIIKQH